MWFSIFLYKRTYVKLDRYTKIKILPSVVVDVGIHIVCRTTLNSSYRLFFFPLLFPLLPSS